MDRVEILNEVNRLVAAGLRKSAIDLIEECLEKSSNDPFMLRALGRVYLLEKKPEQAVKYLQLSLKNSHSEINKKYVTESYESDSLDADDLVHIDKKAEYAEIVYAYADEDMPDNVVDERTNDITSLDILTPLLNSPFSDQDNLQNNNNQSVIEIPKLTDSNSIDTQPDTIDNNFIKNNDLKLDSTDISRKDDDDLSTIPSDNWQSDPFTDEIEASIDEFEDDVFEIEEVEDTLIIPEIDDSLIEKEFGWDDLDDFDEIDERETVDPFYGYPVVTEGKLTRWERAKQIAIEVIQSSDWDVENLSLLQQVFFQNGWGAARLAIEHELAKGLTPEELDLALYIRELWTENQQYWISFIHINSNQFGQQTRAAYKNMSWPESLRIIRSFSNVPSEEEIQLFIDQIYDDWYCSVKLQRQYKAFIKYLKYRTGSVRRTLPGNEIFSFIESYDKEHLLDSSYEFIKHAPGIETLKQERVDIEQMLNQIEQRYSVVKPDGVYGDESVYGDSQYV